MITGKTKSGFKFEVDERIKNDWSLVSAIADAECDDESKRIIGINSLVNIILGAQKQKYFEHIKKKHEGYMPIDVIVDDITSILNSINELKN